MIKVRELNSVRCIVDAFGGTKEVADWAGIGMSAVSNWLERDRIPPGWHYRLDLELKRRGYSVSPEVFGVTPMLVSRQQEAQQRQPAA